MKQNKPGMAAWQIEMHSSRGMTQHIDQSDSLQLLLQIVDAFWLATLKLS